MSTTTNHNVTRELSSAITDEIREAVDAVLAKHGLAATKHSTRYGDLYKFTVEACPATVDENGVNHSAPDAIAYTRFGYYGYVSGVTPNGAETLISLVAPIGTVFASNGRDFAFAGVRARGTKKILGLELATKREFAFADSVIPKINKAAEAK